MLMQSERNEIQRKIIAAFIDSSIKKNLNLLIYEKIFKNKNSLYVLTIKKDQNFTQPTFMNENVLISF